MAPNRSGPRVDAVLRQLERAREALPEALPPCAKQDVATWLRQQPHTDWTEADQAVRKYCKEKQWPGCRTPVVQQLHLRVSAAIQLCHQLTAIGSRHLPPTGPEGEDSLSLLLIDGWHGGGIEWAEKEFGG